MWPQVSEGNIQISVCRCASNTNWECLTCLKKVEDKFLDFLLTSSVFVTNDGDTVCD